ncbi:surfeit locus protein 6-domain-containing protein [Entophlyctis helioformis]|nr:surfeit locus protein 6-domain-containing protein [Entophlyctis helioformis]
MSASTYSLDGLKERLLEHQSAFDALVELIPPKHYFVKDNDNEDYQGGRFGHNKKNKAPKQVIKEATKKAKKLKLDPDAPKSVTDIQAAMAKASRDEDDEEGEGDGMEEEEEKEAKPVSTVSGEELQSRLKRRIAELRARRSGGAGTSSNNTVIGSGLGQGANGAAGSSGASADGAAAVPASPAVPQSRQEIIEKRKQRKEARKEALRKKKENRKKSDDTLGMGVAGKPAPHAGKDKSLEANVTFGKLDFGEDPNKKKKKGPTDALGLLKKVCSAPLAVHRLLEEAWNALIKRAEGTKVKDDIGMLKKTVKRNLKVKSKSSMEWKDRKDNETRLTEARQNRREENIKARIDAKKNKKLGKRSAGGKVGKKTKPSGGSGKRPGFEGGMRKSKK